MPAPLKHLPPLPAERALKVIAGRWKAIVLYQLFSGAKRLSELGRLIPQMSQKVLIQQLREMEQHGLVHREVFRQVPPRVDYSATALGLSLEPVLLALCAWGRHHAAELDELDRLADCPAPDAALSPGTPASAPAGFRPPTPGRAPDPPSSRAPGSSTAPAPRPASAASR